MDNKSAQATGSCVSYEFKIKRSAGACGRWDTRFYGTSPALFLLATTNAVLHVTVAFLVDYRSVSSPCWLFISMIVIEGYIYGSIKIAFQDPPCVDVVKSLKNGMVLSILGMGALVFGMQATVGASVATPPSCNIYLVYKHLMTVLKIELDIWQLGRVLPYCWPNCSLSSGNIYLL